MLGGDVTLNFQGTQYDAAIITSVNGHAASALCKTADPNTYDRLVLFMWSTSHVTPGDFPNVFTLVAPTMQQISPTVIKWSS